MLTSKKKINIVIIVLTDLELCFFLTLKSRAQPNACYHNQQDKLHLLFANPVLLLSLTERNNMIRLLVLNIT